MSESAPQGYDRSPANANFQVTSARASMEDTDVILRALTEQVGLAKAIELLAQHNITEPGSYYA